MQYYICTIPLVALYTFNKPAGVAVIAILIPLVIILRTMLILDGADGVNTFTYQVYQPFYTRGDAYLLGMLMYVM